MSQEPQEAQTPPISPAPGQYEFNDRQNRVFADLAENLIFFGWFVILVVAAFHVVLLVQWYTGKPPYARFRVIQVVWPILVVYVCVQFIRTGKAFNRVAETQGSDITHLMNGLQTLNDGFSWITFLPRIWLVVVVIGAVIGGIIGLVHWLGY